MRILAEHPVTRVSLRWDKALPRSAEEMTKRLRSGVCRAFGADDRFHQHDAQGKPIYRYPLIQYRLHKGLSWIYGWKEAAPALPSLPWLDVRFEMAGDFIKPVDVFVQCETARFGCTDRLVRYRTGSPILLFNQENYKGFRESSLTDQTIEIDRLLVAQILTALRGMDIKFPERLYAGFQISQSRSCRYKNKKLLGITGEFLTNALLPAGFAIGHAVSHGFGWFEPRT